ncbi:MAG: NADH-quinone oxidoreductase subunit G [Actinomycetota bacterium]|uniref:NADH-quinone oxidoreductase n=1 Tax=Mycobacterium lentiflavum TaxID=141349 RepID=A0ABY3UVV3_MYCLN|nr:NADH-quinone oxidoreductase subunit G [Mycobacterium lentiflavum]MEE3066990.1 NADH-quinone oxidoreductase subunit G [Actinomycetota bacterium]ULP43716.1 NADH-quinone oxidoreductase subunit G [Mycobacterium lentiflavum]
MTSAAKTETGGETTPPDMVKLTIDGTEITVPKGTLVIRAAELMGIQIPRFCDHPLLDPVGACRQCMVEVEGQRKPMASCTIVCTDDMVVRTQLTSEAADKAQHGVMELLLINHPLDCPMCDKGGECPLQNQAMSNGRSDSRFEDVKRTFAKPINISSQVLLDRERCILCARCTRFSEQIAGDPFIDMQERGALQQVGIYANEPFDSYFSGNTVQICPVGALTGTAYRFRARPFDLVSSPSVCEHCAGGCAERTDHRRGKVLRRLAGDDPEVNEEWNCDKGRWAFRYDTQPDVLTTPLVRDADGTLQPASWAHAIVAATQGFEKARGRTGVLVGGRGTWEDSYAYAKFARIVLDTNDIDFRARPSSAEEAEFLSARIAGRPLTVSFSDLESAPVVVLVGFEPEDEAPIVFLRLRKAARKRGVPIYAVAPFATRALTKMSGRLLQTVPGAEPAALDDLATGEVGELLSKPGAVIMVGERLATVPGGLSAAARLADATGARLAWVPRRAGERGALEAGALPGLLPGGRLVADDAARAEVAAAWNVDELPSAAGRDADGILAAATDGTLGALLVGGIEPADFADPDAVLAALDAADFVVSLELRHSEVTERADVVFPVAPTTQKAGAFVNWEGRFRPFEPALHGSTQRATQSDHQILDTLADEMGVYLGMTGVQAAREQVAALGNWEGDRASGATVQAPQPPQPGQGEAVLTGWRMLLDNGRGQDGEPYLAGTARKPVVRLSAGTAAEIGAAEGDVVTVSTSRGSISLPLNITDMPDRVVWLPLNSPGSAVHRDLGVTVGNIVRIGAGS